MNFCFFDTRGNILSILTAPSEEYAALQGGEFLECGEAVSDVTHYVDVASGEVAARQPLDVSHAAVGLEVQFYSLPPQLTLRVGTMTAVTEGGEDSVEFDMPGTYVIELSGLPEYMDEILEVTVG